MLRFSFRMIKHLIAVMTAMMNSLLRIFGLPQIPVREPLPPINKAEILSEVRDTLGEAYHVPTSDKLLRPTTEAGHTLWRYACASQEERAEMDLSALSSEQQEWLVMLSEKDLGRLAQVGIDGCTRAIAGKKCGVAKLPEMPAKHQAETNELSTPLAQRIRAYKLAPAFA